MATIQVRVDDSTKSAADSLFASLGMDTSTAVRIFVMASLEAGGIPFSVVRRNNDDIILREAVNYRKAGGEYLTAEQSLEYLRSSMKAGSKNGE